MLLCLAPRFCEKEEEEEEEGFNQRFEEASELVVAWPCTPALGIRKGSAHRKLLQCDVEVMSSEIFSSSYYDNLKRMRVRHYMLVLRGGGTGV